MDVNVNAQTIKARLRLWLHARIILALMYPVLMHSPKPSEAAARSELGEEEGKCCCCIAPYKVKGDPMRGRRGKGMIQVDR